MQQCIKFIFRTIFLANVIALFKQTNTQMSQTDSPNIFTTMYTCYTFMSSVRKTLHCSNSFKKQWTKRETHHRKTSFINTLASRYFFFIRAAVRTPDTGCGLSETTTTPAKNISNKTRGLLPSGVTQQKQSLSGVNKEHVFLITSLGKRLTEGFKTSALHSFSSG